MATSMGPLLNLRLNGQLCSVCCRKFYATVTEQTKRKKKKTFLDKLRVHVRGGAGGQGLPKHGGIGGAGGNIVVVGDRRETLIGMMSRFPDKRFTAGTGGNSRKHHLLGEDAEDLKIHVPLGIVLKNDQGKVIGENRVIGEVNEHQQELVAASGGRGGHSGNNFLGRKGETFDLTLDLKLIADIGLVGFPNAGKSTFLSSVSRANPKIADYPFTTIRPQIGTMMYADHRQITLADLPGLIEGAHVNFGMGHKFLKHIERTKLLLFMVDVGGFQLRTNYPQRTAFETVLLLIKELELYREELMGKPAVLAFNKMDVEGSHEQTEEARRLVARLPDSLIEVHPDLRPSTIMKFDDIFTISAKTGQSVPAMKERLRNLLDVYSDLEKYNQKSKSDDIVTFDTESDVMPSQLREHAATKLV